MDATSRPINLKPAGWFISNERTVEGYSGRLAVCVLGPMTERQWTDLFEALAHHGGDRWKAPGPEVVPAFVSERGAAAVDPDAGSTSQHGRHDDENQC
ncbi:hypothetical protein, partial [Streptomyces albospinus]|uniref:hypothetical protein n=1 Tax=Streptomyces albospinus TaxID=285515 RepID=UPI001671311E